MFHPRSATTTMPAPIAPARDALTAAATPTPTRTNTNGSANDGGKGRRCDGKEEHRPQETERQPANREPLRVYRGIASPQSDTDDPHHRQDGRYECIGDEAHERPADDPQADDPEAGGQCGGSRLAIARQVGEGSPGLGEVPRQLVQNERQIG